jgi:AhpD family alkylhydroperoxidase
MTDLALPPRIAPGDRRAVGLIAWVVAHISGRVTGTAPPNLFLVLGRHRRLFKGWLHFAGRLMPGGTLPRAETELVILRVAHLRRCEYELSQHRRLAKRAGLDDTQIARVFAGPDEPAWTPRQRALLAAVDEMDAHHDLTDEVWTQLRVHLDERSAVEFVMLVAHYEMLATAITTLRVPLDEPRRRRG